MRKTWITLVSLLLLMAMAVPAFAYQHPNQMGDPGGKIAEELSKGANNKPPQSQYAPSTSYPSSGTSNEDFGGQIPWEDNGLGNGNSGMMYDDENDVWVNVENPVAKDPEIPSTGNGGSGVSSGTNTLDWFNGGYDLINKNKSITIYDVNSGVTWSATYINGKNHADVIPASQADANKLSSNKITGSYVRRPVVVTIAGTQYAGSMYAVGHGETSYCNYFKGVMCIHFTGSQTHGSKKVDSDHQNAIQEALKYGN